MLIEGMLLTVGIAAETAHNGCFFIFRGLNNSILIILMEQVSVYKRHLFNMGLLLSLISLKRFSGISTAQFLQIWAL